MGEIYKRDLAETCESFIKIFGANKNLYRIIPSMVDGLRQVSRRFLYSLYKGKGRNEFIKMAKAAGDTMAAYHPHGDTSIVEAGATMANPCKNNVLPVEGQGNFGSYKNEKASSERYIECRLSLYAKKCFFEDFEQSNTPMLDSYTGDDVEPEYLPARYPHALFNPQLSGIGYAFSSNIPPFNVTEVLKATIKLIKDPSEGIFLIPDSPTGADIVDDGQFEEINKNGVGTFTLRGTIEVDEINNTLTITSIPLQTTIDSIMRNIVELRDKKVFDEILSIKDYTKNATGVKTVIQLSQSADSKKTIEKLYSKKTGLKKTYPVGMKMIDNFKDYDYGVKSFLLEWIEYRRDAVRGIYNTKLVDAMDAQNINDALILVLNGQNAEATIKICKTSKNKQECAERLMKKYDIDSQKARVISEMRNYELSEEYRLKYKQRKAELKEEIKKYEKILDDDSMIDQIIIEQLEEGIKLFGSPRKSKVVVDADDEIPNTEHIIAISKDGYIKKVSLKEKIVGQVGNTTRHYISMKVNNKSNILIFDSTGQISKIPVSSITDMDISDTGIMLERYFSVNGSVVAALVEPTKAELKKVGKNVFFTFLTKQGFVKKTLLEEFANINGTIQAIKLPNTDELVAVDFTSDNTSKDMVIYTNLGNGIRRDINEFSVMKANARGARQLVLSDDEYCVGFDKIDPHKKYMFYLTSAGRAKLTDMKYFPSMKRKDDVLSLINLEKNETLVGIHSVSKSDTIVAYKKKSQPQEISLEDIPVSTRVAKAEKYFKTVKGDSVLSYTVKHTI